MNTAYSDKKEIIIQEAQMTHEKSPVQQYAIYSGNVSSVSFKVTDIDTAGLFYTTDDAYVALNKLLAAMNLLRYLAAMNLLRYLLRYEWLILDKS